MRIGIVTYHRTNNYGACLQAVATRFLIEKMGHEAYYLDYWPSYHADKYKLFAWSNLRKVNFKGKVHYLFTAFANLSEKRERIANFNSFLNRFILPYCRPETEDFDAILYGSDQIWRKQSSLKAYNPIYFGKNSFRTQNHIAFAASMGILPVSEYDKVQVKEYVSALNHITVREDNLKMLLQELGYENVERIVDPTLLLSGSEWTKRLNLPEYTGKPYLLLYYITKPAFDMKEIKRFANDRKLEIKILCGSAKSKGESNVYSTADPITFLTLIKNAQFTFVSSFHGLAFSILFHKEVYASYFTNSNRAKTLLDTLGINDRLLVPKTNIDEKTPINYSDVELILKKEQLRVEHLLKTFLYE